MKKLLSIILAAVLMLSLCSCGSIKVPTMDEIRGTIDGPVYTNDFLSLKFEKPESWAFATEEEIESIVGNTQSILTEGGVDEKIDSSRYDMIASDDTTGNNINLSLEIVGSNATDEELEEVLSSTEDQLKEMGGQIGMDYTFGAHTKVNLGGLEYHKLEASAKYLEFNYEQGCYVAVKDGVIVNLTITVYDGTPISSIEALFTE